MSGFFQNVWVFEYAVIPCIVAYLIFDLPILIRRFTRKAYVPVYFAFVPFGFSDELYAKYFDDDSWYVVGGPYKASEIESARMRIISLSVLSVGLTMALSPIMAAIFSHYVLTLEQQSQFFWTLAVVKAVLLCKSLYDLHWEYKVTEVMSLWFVATIYIIYWVFLLTLYETGLDWVAMKDQLGGFAAIAEGVIDYFVFEIGLQIIFFGAVGFLLSWHLTNGTARPQAELDSRDEEQ